MKAINKMVAFGAEDSRTIATQLTTQESVRELDPRAIVDRQNRQWHRY